jgi:hypothetical protein
MEQTTMPKAALDTTLNQFHPHPTFTANHPSIPAGIPNTCIPLDSSKLPVGQVLKNILTFYGI